MAARTVSQVDIIVPNNAWWVDAFQFGDPTDTSWSFAHKDFLCDLKADPAQANADLSLSSSGSPQTLIVDDEGARILHFEVTDLELRDRLQPGDYKYDLIMVDGSTGERDLLMQGTITIVQGVTLED